MWVVIINLFKLQIFTSFFNYSDEIYSYLIAAKKENNVANSTSKSQVHKHLNQLKIKFLSLQLWCLTI